MSADEDKYSDERIAERVTKKLTDFNAALREEFGAAPTVEQKVDALFNIVVAIVVRNEISDEIALSRDPLTILDRVVETIRAKRGVKP